ncbi:uncharacterized protein fbxw9 [Garra rufa]|uniref:uncharacterized protein fbxw9 n=1 Tax=Garra rufa TaxID=137080 RepID=UPI003CCE9900
MSGTSVALEDEETQTCPSGASPPTFTCNDTPHSLPERLNLEPSVLAMETSPSPSSNGTDLLSLPWEIVTQIASHLPAQCVINVLPQVCQMLGKLGEDRLAWQVRAQKLSGPSASFPVGPKEDFDWSKACLEMEHLIGCWTGHENQAKTQETEGERQEEAAGGMNVEAPAAEGNVVEMQLDVNINGAVEPGEENVQVQSQNASNSPQLNQSPLEHIILPSGHIADVNCVLLLGGQEALCASGSRDRNVNLWDLREGPRGTLMHTLAGRGTISTHRGWVWCLASSGPLLVSGSFDSTIRLWDLDAGGAERGLIQCKAAVLCLSCERDLVLAGSHDQKLSIFDTRVWSSSMNSPLSVFQCVWSRRPQREDQTPVPAELSQLQPSTDYQHSRHRRPAHRQRQTQATHTKTTATQDRHQNGVREPGSPLQDPEDQLPKDLCETAARTVTDPPACFTAGNRRCGLQASFGFLVR